MTYLRQANFMKKEVYLDSWFWRFKAERLLLVKTVFFVAV
jgi:hypothetical protein